MNLSPSKWSQVFPILILLGLVSLLGPVSLARAGGEPGGQTPPQLAPSGQCSGYYYTVKLGDTWSKIARRVGVAMGTLKSVNPQAVRPHDLIYAGEQLCIASSGGAQQGGYWYQVRPGDTWNSLSRKTGVPVEQLWDANKRLVNKKLWLYIGQVVWIPALPNGVTPEPTSSAVTPEPPAVPPPATATTKPSGAGPSTATPTAVPPTPTAVPTAVPTATATAVVPPPTPTTAPTATNTPTLVPTATNTATSAPAVPNTATPTAVPTTVELPTTTATPSPLPTMPTAGVPDATSTPTNVPPSGGATAAPTTVPSPLPPTPTSEPTRVLPPIPADCPKAVTAYGDAIAAYLNKAGNTPDTLQNWLVLCRVVAQGMQGVTVAPITGPKSADVIAVVNDGNAETMLPSGTLLVYHKGTKGYVLAHKHQGQGQMALIKAADVNLDGKFDIVYTDTSCGAHTCFGTLFVDSWDGKTYQDWITDEPTMAYPQYSIQDVRPEGQGNEILVHGGVIGSVGAGPQRAWTETYISSKGAPYVLFSQVYDPSTCLYHKILDANRAFDAWALDGFEPAIEAYKAAIADPNVTACGTIKDEVATLKDFARFRLIVADIAAGRASDILDAAGQITNKPLAGAAAAFLSSYKANTSVIQACRDTNKYAEANPGAWQFLADWGYANPSFTAQDLCPLN